MSKVYFILTLFFFVNFNATAQIDPLDSPYYPDGSYIVEADSNMTDLSVPILYYHPETEGTYPVFMFQLGANGFGSSVINRHTYDLFMKHLASYGFTVIVIDDSQAGFPSGTSFKNVHDWYKDNITDPNHWLATYADPDKLVIGGHSNGGVNASALLVDRPTEIDGIVFMDSYPSPGLLGLGAHDVSGYTGKELTMTANENNPEESKDGYEAFTSTECKTYVSITGLDHGGFGDYDLDSQPVGSIGREDATATIRHFLVSWMLTEFKDDAIASTELGTTSLQPNTVTEFLNNCEAAFATNIENQELENVLIFPNPFKNQIAFSGIDENMNIEVFNAVGKLVFQKNNISANTVIDLGDLSKGIYFIKALDMDGNVLFLERLVRD